MEWIIFFIIIGVISSVFNNNNSRSRNKRTVYGPKNVERNDQKMVQSRNGHVEAFPDEVPKRFSSSYNEYSNERQQGSMNQTSRDFSDRNTKRNWRTALSDLEHTIRDLDQEFTGGTFTKKEEDYRNKMNMDQKKSNIYHSKWEKQQDKEPKNKPKQINEKQEIKVLNEKTKELHSDPPKQEPQLNPNYALQGMMWSEIFGPPKSKTLHRKIGRNRY